MYLMWTVGLGKVTIMCRTTKSKNSVSPHRTSGLANGSQEGVFSLKQDGLISRLRPGELIKVGLN